MTGGFRAAIGPFSARKSAPTSEPQKTWFTAERDVILAGPIIHAEAVWSARGDIMDALTVTEPGGSPTRGRCSDGGGSRGGRPRFRCQLGAKPGVGVVSLSPRSFGGRGDAASVPIRVLDRLPPLHPAQDGWRSFPLANGTLADECYIWGGDYHVILKGDQLSTATSSRRKELDIPAPLRSRLSPKEANGIAYVFETNNGWLVMSNYGEFGGRIDWYDRGGGPPRPIFVGDEGERFTIPQNVNRALAVGDAFYVLQGITHLSSWPGRFAALWREHDHFTSRVIARYSTEPFDWIQEADGAWLVATYDGIFRTETDGTTALVARFPDMIEYPNSVARASDGTIYVGARGGVLRMIPAWPEAPRYASDWLMPSNAVRAECTRAPCG